MLTHWPRGVAVPAAVLLALAGCGGGGSSGVTPAPEPTPLVTPSPAPGPAPAPAPAPVAQACSTQNPYRADATAPAQTGSLQTEKAWVRAYVDAAYLWYDEVPSVNADLPEYSIDTTAGFHGAIDSYFKALKVPAKDHFSFTYSTKAWNSLSESGVSASHGIDFHLGSATPPRGVRVAFIEPGSPAATAGARRGDTLVSVDGISPDAGDTGYAKLREIWTGNDRSVHRYVFSRGGAILPVMHITGVELTRNPVPDTLTLSKGQDDTVGYLLFNTHNAPSEAKLISSIAWLREQRVKDLVLDLRYNGGGLLRIASQLAYMIAGPQRTAGKVFMKLKFNAKRTQENAEAPTPFLATSMANQALPTLNLGRLFVLTSSDTCSASEAIINGLEGVGVKVVRIGTQTCGKPYGYAGKDNCGITYFPIEFSGVNDKGVGDYANGFAPTCQATDDLNHPLGNPDEAQLSAALIWRDTGSCPATTSRALPAGATAMSPGPVGLARDPVHTSAFLGGWP